VLSDIAQAAPDKISSLSFDFYHGNRAASDKIGSLSFDFYHGNRAASEKSVLSPSISITVTQAASEKTSSRSRYPV
jgi:hypothetical protein